MILISPEPTDPKTAGYPGSSSFGEEPIPEMNFSADASNDHDNLYEQGIWGKTKTRVGSWGIRGRG